MTDEITRKGFYPEGQSEAQCTEVKIRNKKPMKYV